MIRAAQILTLTAALLGALAAATGCGKAVDETDSESHFLAFCTDECADGLSCVCGVCTKACAGDGSCDSLAFGARCAPLAVSSCAATSGELACDVECSTDSDCGGVGARHECLSGRCRASENSLSNQRIDAGVIVSSPQVDDRPVVLPELVAAGCCPQIAIDWGAHELDRNCRFARKGVPVNLCESQLPTTCNDPVYIDGADIQAALLHPDVTNLIIEARNSRVAQVFGWNGGDESATPYPLGADFLEPQRGSASFYAGVYPHDCSEVVDGASAASDCVPIPAGVRAFAELEQTLLLQQLSLGTCAPDLSCYAPRTTIEQCNSQPPAATYDVEASACVTAPWCPESGNSFESLLACDQSCSNDPCAFGDPITDQACSGVSTRLLAAPLSPRCFANATRACVCACAQTGAPLDSCIVQQGALPEAVCGP
jgi:hypothetical protein